MRGDDEFPLVRSARSDILASKSAPGTLALFIDESAASPSSGCQGDRFIGTCVRSRTTSDVTCFHLGRQSICSDGLQSIAAVLQLVQYVHKLISSSPRRTSNSVTPHARPEPILRSVHAPLFALASTASQIFWVSRASRNVGADGLLLGEPFEEIRDLVDEAVLVADGQAGHPPLAHVGMVAVGHVDAAPAAKRAFGAVVEPLQRRCRSCRSHLIDPFSPLISNVYSALWPRA